ALRLDHVRELGGEVDVRHLERAGRERAEPVRVARNADGRRARVRRLLVLRAGERLQPGLVREAGEGDLRDRGRRAGRRVDVGDDAVLADRHRRRVCGDGDLRVRRPEGRGRALRRDGVAEDVVALLRHEVAVRVGGEVAGAGVLDGAEGGRRAGGLYARDAEPAGALDRQVERVAG